MINLKRYIYVSIGGKNVRIEIDNALLRGLEKSLKRKLEFDESGNIKTNFESNEDSYKAKQVVLRNLLAQINNYEIDDSLQDRAKYLKGFVNPKKSTVYSSDLAEMERLLLEATEMYDRIKRYGIPEKSREKKEIELKEKVVNASSTTEKIEAVKDVIENFQDNELSGYFDDEVLDKAIENVVIASSNEEYNTLTSEVLDTNDALDESLEAESLESTGQNETEKQKVEVPQKIILPPTATVEDIALEVIDSASKGTVIESAVKELKENKGNFKGDIVAGLNNLTSNIKTQGLNYRNLNYFGDNFIKECDRLCRESGQSLEDMFRDYFSASSSTRANSVLNRFILSFITRNGNDSSLRGLIEATLVKKAISNHLISSRFNNYLSEEYRNLSVNGSGYINFESKVKNEVETSNGVSEIASSHATISSDGIINNNINISGNINANREVNLNSNINSEVSIDSENNISSNVTNEVNFNSENNINGSNSKVNINNNSNLSGKSNNNFNVNNNSNSKVGDNSQPNDMGIPNRNMPGNRFGINRNLANNIGALNNDGLGNAFPESRVQKTSGMPNIGVPNPLGGDIGNNNNALNFGAPDNLMSESPNNLQNNLYGSPSMAMAGVSNRPKNDRDLASGRSDEEGTGTKTVGRSNKAKKNSKGAGSATKKGLRRNGLLNPNMLNSDSDELNNESLPQNNSANTNIDDSNEPNINDSLDNNNANNENNQNINNDNDDGNQNEKDSEVLDQIKKQIGKKILAVIKKHPWVIAVAVGIILFLFLLLIIISYSNQKKKGMLGLGGYPYLELTNVCEEIHVYDTPSGEDGTYPLEEYIAGVVAHEVGAFNDDTLYEVFAIAARTYALRRLQNSGDCSIPGNTKAQVFGKTSNERIIEAANKTRGIVLTRDNGLASTEYDAFCWDTKEGTNYNICQKNYDTGEVLKVPETWAQEYVAKISGKTFLTNPRYQSHGRGMSQQGAYYMAMELGYTRDQILAFFYGSEAKLMSIYASSYTGEFPLNPNDELYQNLEFIINRPLSSILEENGTSVEEFNNYLANIVETSGVGTREAVVNVGVSLIGSLANMGYKLNYQWGGKYYAPGVNANFGEQRSTGICASYGKLYNIDKCLTHYKWASFDCSGFVNWALLNGFGLSGYRELEGRGIYAKTQTHLADRVDLNPNKAVCQAGDVLIKPGAHIVLIVGTDDSKNSYIVAESTGSNINTKTGGVKLSYYNYAASGYFCGDMSSIYKNNNKTEEE